MSPVVAIMNNLPWSGTFGIIDGLRLIHCYQLRFIVYTKIHWLGGSEVQAGIVVQ